MKVGNKLLNRVVAVGMMAVVLVCGFSFYTPQTVKASSFLSFDFTNLDSNGNACYKSDGSLDHYVSQIQFSGDSNPTLLAIYCPYKSNKSFFIRFVAIGKGGLSVPKITTVYDNGETYTNNGSPIGSAASGLDSYSCYAVGGKFGGNGKANFSAYVISTTPSEWNDYYNKYKTDADILMQYVKKYLANRDGFTYVSNGTDEFDSIPDGSRENPIKSDKLGTLVDMEKHYQSFVEMGDSDSGSVVSERTHHWGWNKKTSTGLNLINNDSFDSIETYCYLKVYDVSKKNWITGNKTKIESDKFKKLFFVDKGDASKLMIEIKQTHIWNDILTKEVKEIGDSLGANDALHNLDYSYDFYFQLIGQKNGKYYKGDFVHFKKDGTAEEITGGKYDVSSNTATEDENGDLKDNDDKKTGEGATGTGDNYDDAKNNADSVSNTPSSNTLDLDSAKAFIQQVSDVPKMIADIFSFLPDWVKYSFAFGFALIPILIIFKLIRG